MTCYTALLIYRLLEVRLNRKGRHFTTCEIIENLKNMNVVNAHDLYYQATYSSSLLCDALNEEFKLDLDREYYQPKDLKNIKKNFKIVYPYNIFILPIKKEKTSVYHGFSLF